jgi:hypothetical protein
MTRDLMYLIGQPGSGKTTLMRATLLHLPTVQVQQPFAHLLFPNGIEIGGIRPGFGGTDMLPMNCQPGVIQWLQNSAFSKVVAEGDRLANDKFFAAMKGNGWNVHVVYLRCDDGLAADRRALRRSAQNVTWIKGRISKVERLSLLWVPAEWVLDAAQPLHELASRLRQHPVVAALAG